MKLFECKGLPETVAAMSRKHAELFFQDLWNESNDVPFNFGDVSEVKDVETRQMYDEEGWVHGEPGMVTYKEMMDYDLESWNMAPYVFCSLEN